MLILDWNRPAVSDVHGRCFSKCLRKTNLAMMVSALESQGYRVWTVGDDLPG